MCLRFVFLLISRWTWWPGVCQHEETWKTAEILILRHQLTVLQRRQPRRPKLDWADRALLATLLAVIPKARPHGLRLLERQLGKARPRFCPGDRAFLAALLHRLLGNVLGRLRLLIRPDTVLRCHRDLLARRHAARSRPKSPGRPRSVPLKARSPRRGTGRVLRDIPSSSWPATA